MNALNRIVQIGDSPSDSNSTVQKHHFMVYMGLIMGMGGLVWGGLASYFKYYEASVIPFGYTVVTIFNFLFFAKYKNFRVSSFVQVFFSLALPFIFQWGLGGFVSSGMVMMWAVLAVIGSLAFYETRSSRIWITLFLIFTMLSYFVDPYLGLPELGLQIQNNEGVSRLFFLINISVVSAAVYFLVVYFINIRNEANRGLEERNEEIELQQELLMQQNENVMSSIAAAKKIQSTIIPEADRINEVCSDSFVMYKPRDVVSGDFYWMKRNYEQTKFFFAVADCTGHGVPGAFMSILNSSLLERAVRSSIFEYSPEKILDYIRRKLIETLKQSENQGKDGMDIGLFCFDQQSRVLRYSGAYIGLILVRKAGTPLKTEEGEEIEPKVSGEEFNLYEIKATKTPIGYYFGRGKEFKLWNIQTMRGDRIYLTTDGFPDQFGGPKREDKFSMKNIKNLILETSNQSMSDQRMQFEASLKQWRQHTSQTDDICMVGMEL